MLAKIKTLSVPKINSGTSIITIDNNIKETVIKLKTPKCANYYYMVNINQIQMLGGDFLPVWTW